MTISNLATCQLFCSLHPTPVLLLSNFSFISPPSHLFLTDLVQTFLGFKSYTVAALFTVMSPLLTFICFPACSSELVLCTHWELMSLSSVPPAPQVFHAGDLWRGGRSRKLPPLCSLVQEVWCGVSAVWILQGKINSGLFSCGGELHLSCHYSTPPPGQGKILTPSLCC